MRKQLLLIILYFFYCEVVSEGSKEIYNGNSATPYCILINRNVPTGSPVDNIPFGAYTPKPGVFYPNPNGSVRIIPSGTVESDYSFNVKICNTNERVSFGFQLESYCSGADSAFYRIKDPNGNIVFGPKRVPSSGKGYITSFAQASAGPQSVVGASGYNDESFTPSMVGDYTFEFNLRNRNTYTYQTSCEIRIKLFDISVVNTSNNSVINGRLWSKAWQFGQPISVAAADGGFFGKLFVYSDDGVVTRLDCNGMQPRNFSIYCNSYGLSSSLNQFQSRLSRSGQYGAPQYKIFLNDPDINCYPNGVIGTAKPSTMNVTCTNGGYCFNVETTSKGIVSISINLDGVSGYQPNGKDVMIDSLVPGAGNHCVFWNGKDALGNVVNSITNVDLNVSFVLGLTHLPLYDCENNNTGFKVNLVRPNTGSLPLFWNDSLITSGGKNLTGCSTAAGCHKWNSNFGDQKTINTWWYAKDTVFTKKLTIPSVTVDANKIKLGTGSSNNDSLCGDGSKYQLQGRAINASTGIVWSSTGTGVFSNVNDTSASYTPSAQDLSNGSVKLRLESNPNGACRVSRDSLVLTFVKPITLNQGADTVVCKNNTSIKLYATGSNYKSVSWSGGGSFTTTNTSLTPTYTPSIGELNQASFNLTLTAISTQKQCANVSKVLNVKVLPTPIVNAGSDISVCGNNPNFNLNGTSTTGGGIWSGGINSNFQFSLTSLNNAYKPQNSESSKASLELFLTSTNNRVCTAVKDTITVFFSKKLPTVDLGNNKEVCSDNPTVTLTANVSNASGIKWSNFSGQISPSDTSKSITYILSNNEVNAGFVKLKAITTDNQGCSAGSDSVLVTVKNAPIVNAGPDIQVCFNNPNASLNGTVTNANGSNPGAWSGEGGSFTQGVSTLQNTYIPTQAELDFGSSLLELRVTGQGSCGGKADTLIITYLNPPTVDAGLNKTICANNPNIQLGDATSSGASVFKWTTSGTGLFFPSDNVQNPQYQASISDTLLPSLKLKLSVNTTNPPCVAIVDSVIINVVNSPKISAGPDLQLCRNNLLTNMVGTSSTGAAVWSLGANVSGNFSNVSADGLSTSFTASAQDLSGGGPLKLKITSINNGNCTAVKDSMQISFISSPTISAGADKTVCGNNALLSDTAKSSTGSIVWSNYGGTLTPNINSEKIQYLPSQNEINAGRASLIVTSQNNGLCNPVSDTLNIIINPKPEVNAGNDLSVCADVPSTNILGTINNAAGGIWSVGQGVFSKSNTVLNNNYTASNGEIQAGNAELVLTSTGNGLCNPESDTLNISILPSPIVDAGNDQTVCSNSTSVTLSGSFSNAGGVEWSTDGTGTFVDKNAAITQYSPSVDDKDKVALTFTLKSTQNGLCKEVVDQVRVLFTSAPTLDAGNDNIVCVNDLPIQLSAIGSPAQWSGGLGSFVPNDKTLNAQYLPDATEISSGKVTLTLTSENNDECPKLSDQVTITIKQAPVANAGSDQGICGNTPKIILNSQTPNVLWSILEGAGTIVSPNSQSTSYNIIEQDKFVGFVKILLTTTNNAECSAVKDTVTYTISKEVMVDAGPDKNICANNAKIQLNGVIQNAVTGTWTGGNGTFSNIKDLAAIYTPSASELSAGNKITLKLTSDAAAPCPGFSADVKFTITAAPSIQAGSDQSICADVDSVHLVATTNSIAGGVEWQSLGSGLFAPSFANSTTDYYMASSDYSTGNVKLVAKTVASGNCLEVNDTLTVTIMPKPTIQIIADTVICADKSTMAVVANVTSATGANWVSYGTGAFNSLSGLNNVYNITSTDLLAGFLTLEATSTGNGLCRAVKDQLFVEIKPSPTVTVGQDQVTCANIDSIDIGAIFTVATSGKWTSTGNGTFVADSQPFTKYVLSATDKLSGKVSLMFTTTNNGNYGCDPVSDTLDVVINAQPLVDLGPDVTICADSIGISITRNLQNASGVVWSTTGTGGFFPNTIADTVQFVPSTIDRENGKLNIIIKTTGNGACNPSFDTLQLNILPKPEISAGNDQIVCTSNSIINLTGTVKNAGGLEWLTSSNGTFVPDKFSLNAQYQLSTDDINIGKVVFNVKSTNNGLCKATFDQVEVNLEKLPIVDAGNNTTICASNLSFSLDGEIQSFSGLGHWTSNGDGVFANGTGALSNIYQIDPNDLNKTLELVLTSDGAVVCTEVKDTLLLSFSPVPTITAIDDFEICQDVENIDLSVIHTVASGVEWFTNGKGSLAPNAFEDTISYSLSNSDRNLSELKFVISTIGNGACLPAKDSILVSLTPQVVFNAGNDIFTCADQKVVYIESDVSVAQGVKWETSGNGFFLPDEFAADPLYVASPEDSLAGYVRISGVTTGNGTCKSKSDFVDITLDKVPFVSAGTDITICLGADSIKLDGVLNNASNPFWATSGTGTFEPNIDSLSAYYRPSAEDYANGSVTLYLAPQNVGYCQPITSSIEVKFSPAPTISAGADKTVCDTDLPIKLEGSGSSGQWIGAGTFTPSPFVLNAHYTPSASELTLGKVQLVVESIKQKTCAQGRDTVEFIINKGPLVDAGPDQQSICANGNGLSLSLATNNGISPSIKWSTASGKGVFLPNANTLNATFVPAQNQIDAGKATLFLETTSNGICNVSKDIVTLFITPAPTISLGSNMTICADLDTMSLESMVTIASDVSWLALGGDGSFTDLTSDTTSYVLGNNDKTKSSLQIIATTKNVGTCNEVSDTIDVKITPKPSITASNDTTICSNSQDLALKVVVSGATGVVWNHSNFGVISPDQISKHVLYQLFEQDRTLGKLRFDVSTTGMGSCKPVSDSVIVTLNQLPSIKAQDDTLICSTFRPIKITSQSTGGVLWSGGTNNFGNANLANTTYTMDQADIDNGSILLKVETVNNGVCPKVEDFALIQIIPSPEVVVNAGFDQELCQDNIEVGLQGFVLNAGGGEWSTIGGTGTFSNSKILDPKYFFSNTETTAPKLQFVLTSTDNGRCNFVTDTMEVRFTPKPDPQAGSDMNVCEDTAFVDIAAVYGVASDHIWTSTGDGVFTPNNKAINAKYIPGPDDIANKEVGITLTTQNNGTCIGNYSDDLVISLVGKPFVDAGADKAACNNVLSVSLNGIVRNALGLNWTSSGNGVFSPNGTSAKYIPTFTDKAATKVQLTATSVGNNVCKAVNDKMLVTFNPVPKVSAGPDVTYCASTNTISLLGKVDPSQPSQWLISGNGTFDPSPSSLSSTYNLSDDDKLKSELTFTLFVRTINGCTPVSDQVVFKLQPVPTVDPGPTLTCAYLTGVQLAGSVSGALGAKWSTSTGSGVFARSEDSLKAKYYLSQKDLKKTEIDLILSSVGNGVCPADVKSTKLTVNPLPVALAGADQFVCINAPATLSAFVYPGVEKYQWTDVSSNNVVGNDPIVLTSPMTSNRKYTLKVTDVHGCFDVDTVLVSKVDTARFGILPHYCLSNELEISARVSNPSPFAVYQWFKNDNILQGKIDSNLILRDTGSYRIDYTVGNCTYKAHTHITEPPYLFHNDRIACSNSNLLIATRFLSNVVYTWQTGVPKNNESDIVVLADTNRYHVSALDNFGCKSSDSVRVIGIDRPIIQVKDTSICDLTSIQLVGNFINSSILVPYLPETFWIDGNDTIRNVNITVNKTGDYTYHAIIDACEGVDTSTISVNALPDTVLVDNILFCNEDGKTLTLDAGASNGLSYLWSTGETTSTIVVRNPGIYTVMKKDQKSCSITDTIFVGDRCGPRFYLPEAFTPNSSDKDDKMYIFGRNFKNMKLTIFNRWGEVIYYTEDRNMPWDGIYLGKYVETGVYPYLVTYEGIYEDSKGHYEKRGNVMVIRVDK